MATDFDNNSDVIDSRDVIEAIEELKAEDDLMAGLSEDDAERLRALLALQEEAEDCGDWKYGATLIRDSYFEDYAQETAESIGAISENAPWPTRHIDWKAAAEDLQQDYTSVEFDGVTYWIRS